MGNLFAQLIIFFNFPKFDYRSIYFPRWQIRKVSSEHHTTFSSPKFTKLTLMIPSITIIFNMFSIYNNIIY